MFKECSRCESPFLRAESRCLPEKLQGIVSVLLDGFTGNKSNAKVPCYMKNKREM